MLLQLMVYAKIIYLLMVVISGALCTVEDYVIMSQCAHNKAINLAAEGTVSVTDISQTQNITIVGRPDFVNNNFKIALYAKETQRYLCFNDHWKLVGMKELQDTCYFNEAIVHGYFVFRSVVDMQRRIGFTQRGRAVGPKKTVNDACYMFTKIPTDQFFHQHNTHFSAAPKTKSTTTKIPKTEYTHTHTPYTTQAGRGSGGGRTKTNRFKNPQRQEDAVTHNHSGHGHGSGSGSGGGSGSGNGSKKFKKQRNGNKQQRQQKQKQEMQQQIRGHSYNLSNPKNSTYLNSSRQNLLLSQHSINNHTNKKHNNNNNNNNHPPQNHQVRHHHNDPNKVARRQQHDQKQKTKLRQRVRPSPSSASAALTPAVAATTTTTTATTSLTTAKLINSSKPPHHTLSSSYSDIHPTSVIPTISTDATADIQNTMSSTLVVAKRKGRRRKGDKLHKKGLQKKLEQERQHSREQTEKDSGYSSSVGPAYDEEEEEFITSSTDYAWMTNDITMSAVKPTSASLPSWDTWYPSSSTAYTEDVDADYSLGASATASSATETNADTRFSTTLESSSSMTDLDKNTLSSQTSVPLPTSVFTTTLTENSIDETISPTVTTTDLGTTTTNTSTYTQTDFWSTSLNDNTDADILATGFTSDTFNTYATPQLENTQNILNTDEATNALSTQPSKDDSENSTAAITLSTNEDDNDEEHEVSSPPTERTSDEVSEDTTWLDGSTFEMTSSGNYEKANEAATTTTTTYTNDCAYSTASTHNGSETMTDCMFATKTTAPIANNHKPGETTPLQYTTQTQSNNNNNDNVPKMEAANKVTTSTALNSIIIPIRSDKTTSLPETTSTTTTQSHTQSQTSTQFSKTPEPAAAAPATPLQLEEKSIHTTFTTATASSSTVHATKSPVPLALTTRKSLRKSTQKLLATPFHQLTYVRNEAGDIDIDSIDNISIYPELLDNDNDEPLVKPSTSRLTMISGYLPTSATATLPESIRIAKIKINRERKRMLRLRNVGNYA
ncbi:mucin-2 [Calliphora vicina]|uniref:mucin-2 n=1 Tax=Calliphora vicina TaxID=7373 RepID=UPI00325A70B4